jgi:hypothetical protein
VTHPIARLHQDSEANGSWLASEVGCGCAQPEVDWAIAGIVRTADSSVGARMRIGSIPAGCSVPSIASRAGQTTTSVWLQPSVPGLRQSNSLSSPAQPVNGLGFAKKDGTRHPRCRRW